MAVAFVSAAEVVSVVSLAEVVPVAVAVVFVAEVVPVAVEVVAEVVSVAAAEAVSVVSLAEVVPVAVAVVAVAVPVAEVEMYLHFSDRSYPGSVDAGCYPGRLYSVAVQASPVDCHCFADSPDWVVFVFGCSRVFGLPVGRLNCAQPVVSPHLSSLLLPELVSAHCCNFYSPVAGIASSGDHSIPDPACRFHG